MKILLVNPNYRGEFVPNIGLAYIATVCKQDHEVKVADLTFHRKRAIKYIRSIAKEFCPDIVGFSVLTFNYIFALDIARIIKEDLPAIFVIFGGVHATLMPESILEHDFTNAVCIGEGELTLKELACALEAGLPLETVNGIWYREGNAIKKNPPRPLLEDLNSLPFPDWNLWDIAQYLKNPITYGQIPILGSRGCPFNCSFCSNEALRNILTGKYVRIRTPENVIQEISQLFQKYYSYGFRIAYFWDENLTTAGNWSPYFFNLFQEGFNKKLLFSCNLRADLVREEWAQAAARAGCYYVRMGIEAGNARIREVIYCKHITSEQITRAREILRGAGILVRFNFILGGPGETVSTMRETWEMKQKQKPDIYFFSIFQPLPRTSILKEIENQGGFVEEDLWRENYDFWKRSILNTKHLTRKEVVSFRRRILLREIRMYAYRGLKLRYGRFFVDIFKYFLKYLIWERYPIYGLAVFTIHRYIIEDWQQKTKRNNSSFFLC